MQSSIEQFVLELLISMILIGTFFSGLTIRPIEMASCTRAAGYAASSALAWNKTYGGTGSDFALALFQIVDGGYALAGSTTSFGAGSYDFWLVRTDVLGNMLWNRTYGGAGEDRAYSLVQTVDGGYALAGCTYSYDIGNGDFWLVRTDAFGNHLWNKTHGGAGEDWPYALIETTNEEYALAGVTNSFGAGSSDFWLVKTDAFGNHLWNRTYGGTGEDYAGSLVQTSDAGYALAGGTKSFGAGSDDFWLVKTVREASTIIVPDDYSMIQEAINNAIDGDTVLVKAGTYYEQVVVNKSLSIFGEKKENTLIDGNKTGPVILVAANGVNLTEFTIRAGQNSHPICDVWLENVSKCSIHGNILTYSFYGVYLDESNGNSIYENFATDVSIGICGFRSDWNSVFRNEFVANSFAGINFHLCSFNNVTENLISGNSVGMRLLDGANNNTIHHNNFVNNTVQVYVQSSYNNIWDDGYPSGGNYWSDYGGVDEFNGSYQNVTGRDGIGDIPYVIDANNRDNYPLMDPWTSNGYDWIVDDDGPADFSTIQEAINAASDGDTILVKAGIYYEHVVVNKTVSLLGEDVGTTIVDGNKTGNVFAIDRDSVNIAGFTVQNSGSILGNAGLRLDNVGLCSISGNRIRDNFAGIWFEGASENLITANEIAANVDDGIVFNYSHNNTISGNHIAFHEYFGIVINWSHNNTICFNNVTRTFGPSHGDGINLWKSSNNTIFQNQVEENNRYGIRVEVQSNNNTISDNIIRDCLTGLQLYDSSNSNLIYANNVTQCSDGIDINQHSTQNILSNNTITDNTICGVQIYNAENNLIDGNNLRNNWAGIGAHGKSHNNHIDGNNIENCTNGVLLHDSDYNTICRNNITECEIAIHFEWLTNFNTVEQNNIVNNDCGVQLEETSGNIFYHNNVAANTFEVSIIGYASDTWDNGYPSGGNYWSNYNGIDLCTGPFQNETGSDGIGDTPYVIDVDNRDRYPLMNPHTPQPDVAVINVSPFKTVVGLDYCLNMSITATNQGDYDETFNLTAYANTTNVASQNVTLPYGNSITVTFTWNTTGFAFGNYTLSAYAWPIPEEIDVANNNYMCTYSVHVGVAGDVSSTTQGVPDGMVNMRDINYSILLFNTRPGTPKWNPNADVNNDSTVNMRDIQIAILNFNKHE